ncbi:MAG: DUF3570 domain-containing protein [Myxococcota bacterium]|nr:DUF3570 domain-containing protein [Myxococcota bacterium]
MPRPVLRDTATEHAVVELAGYTDSDHVTVVTPSVSVGVENVAGASLTGTYLVDVVSAASADIVSSASRRWEEVRQAGTLSAQYKPHDFGVAVGTSVSSEPDYLSYGAYAIVIEDFDQKNWTLTLGYGFSHDTAGRCGAGDACTSFSVFSRELQRGSFTGGIDWVVNRTSLASITADVILESGDQSKPYRYVPLFAPRVAPMVTKGASIDTVNSLRLPERPLEQLPLSRQRYALTGRYAHRYDKSTLRLEERVYDDSWGLTASSTDAKWILDLGKRFAIWPHGRFHVQSPVGFWQRAYVSGLAMGWDLPQYRTGDRELGPLWTAEGGLGIRWFLGSEADPHTWQVGLHGDVAYTSFLDDLYLTTRIAAFGALTLEGQW